MAELSSVDGGSDAVRSDTCEKHAGMLIKQFCKEHGDIVCDTCVISSHKHCTLTYIADEISKMKKDQLFKDTLSQFDKLKVDYEALLQSRKKDKTALVLQCDECLDDVHKLREDTEKILKALETKVENDIKDIKSKLTYEIDRQCLIINETIPQIENMIDNLSKSQKQLDSEDMFVAMVKAKRHLPDYVNIKSSIETNVNDVDIRFKADPFIDDHLQQLKSLGKVFVKKKSVQAEQNMKSILNTAVLSSKTHDVGSKSVFGCSFMQDGQLLLACGNDGVKLLDDAMNLVAQLAEPAFDVTAMETNDVIIAQGSKQQLKGITIKPSLKAGKTFKVGRNCWSVDADGAEIFVACHDDPGNGEVRVLNMDGTLQRRLGIYHNNFLFIRPTTVRVSKNTHTLFVSDSVTNIVTCLDKVGTVNYQYHDADIKRPAGIYVDDDDNLLVCGHDSNNVHVITRDGKRSKVMAMTKDNVERPTCVAYRPSDGCLMLGLRDKDAALITYQSKKDSPSPLTKYLYGWLWPK